MSVEDPTGDVWRSIRGPPRHRSIRAAAARHTAWHTGLSWAAGLFFHARASETLHVSTIYYFTYYHTSMPLFSHFTFIFNMLPSRTRVPSCPGSGPGSVTCGTGTGRLRLSRGSSRILLYGTGARIHVISL